MTQFLSFFVVSLLSSLLSISAFAIPATKFVELAKQLDGKTGHGKAVDEDKGTSSTFPCTIFIRTAPAPSVSQAAILKTGEATGDYSFIPPGEDNPYMGFMLSQSNPSPGTNLESGNPPYVLTIPHVNHGYGPIAQELTVSQNKIQIRTEITFSKKGLFSPQVVAHDVVTCTAD